MTRILAGALVACCLLVGSTVQAQRAYRVRRGDTLSEIARRFDVSVRALRRANRLGEGSTLHPGDRLRVPGRRRASRGSRRRSGVYRVRRGDTLSEIASRFDASIRRIRRANGLDGNMIRPGQRLQIPGKGMGRQRPEGRRPDELSEAQRKASKRADELGLGSGRVAHRLLTKPPKDEWVEAAGSPSTGGTLASPIEQGTFLRGWGSGPGGYHLAVDLRDAPGSKIQAAAPGIVAYAGSQVRGYGNIVILVHPNGWVTWYAHNRQNLVVPGQRVERGQPIATVGATGYARGAHLHFMLVHEGEHCDPMPLMRGELVDRGGDPVEGGNAKWLEQRPEEVRCLPKSARPHPSSRRRRRGR